MKPQTVIIDAVTADGAGIEGGRPAAAGCDATVVETGADLTPSQELGSMASVLAALARTAGGIELAPGTLVADQYRIERAIGEGGMGIVFLARDTRLDRPVAVKLCTGLSASAVHRIQREAMALAKLAHPNVVVVFQAGELDGRFFIAMEHVAGGTARTWLGAAPRSPQEILALYVDAGTGLAAAHAEGLVHRDFKPDNVLVGADGRPRVADFGLVQTSRERARDSPTGPDSSTAELATQDGTVLGTLAYMPPEQLAGAELDPRADQYAFAASLWEALMGWRPTAAVAESRGPLPVVPRHVVAALRRALASDPAERWPDLPTLLAELRRDPTARRRRVLLAAGTLALTAAVAAAAVANTRSSPPPCEDGAERIAAVWGPQRRVALEAAVGVRAWPTIEPRVQARADAWVDAEHLACRATWVDGVADEEQLYRRMLCLENRRDELDVTLDALRSGSPTAVSNAAEALDLLPASATCLELDPAAEIEPAPTDPRQRVAIAAARRAVAEANAAALDPAVLDPRGKANRAVSLARATQWSPVIAEALAAHGDVAFNEDRDDEAVAAQREASRLAIAAGHDVIAVQALASEAWALANTHRIGEATLVLAIAQSLWERAGKPSSVEHLILGAEAHVALRDHRPRDALAATRAQILAVERALGTPATSVATNQFNLAIALSDAGELHEAMLAVTRAIELARGALGDEHPKVAQYRALAAKIATQRGDMDEANALAQRALENLERWFGPRDIRLGVALDVLGIVAQQQGRIQDADTYARRHLEIRRLHDPESQEIPKLETNIAIAAVRGGDFAAAAPMAKQALASLEQRLGPDDPTLVPALILAGHIQREQPYPDLDAAQRHFMRALALAVEGLGPDHTETLNVEIELAITDLAQGEPDDAVARLEPRLAQLDVLELPRHQPSELRFTLARALAATGAHARACILVNEAEDGFRDAQLNVEAVTEWRAQHCSEGLRYARQR